MSNCGRSGKTSTNSTPPLLPQHLADLHKSGLSDEAIARCGFYSETNGDTVRGLLNWTGKAKAHLGAVLVIPYYDATGARTGYVRIKPDSPRSDPTDSKQHKYEAPARMGNRPYFPPRGATTAALADPSAAIIITEGEKKSAKADQEGFACLGLSGVWNWVKKGTKELIDELAALTWAGRRVYIVFDSDAAEKENVRLAESELARVLSERGAVVVIVRLPAAANGDKVGLDDFLAANPPDALRDLLIQSSKPPEVVSAEPALPAVAEWPKGLAPEAFHGLAGDVVRALEPHTEADAAALLLQLLVGVGSMIGRSAHFTVEGDKHFGNEFVVLVGRSSKGRKGTSWGQIFSLLRGAEEEWATRVRTGLSSAEGLVWNVRDAITSRQPVKEKGRVTGYEEVEADPGVTDKRLLIYEPEFANVLKQTERQGNTLSAMLRQAWDSGDLGTLTKNSPARATSAHVSLIGHITADELRRYLTATEQANGFANRHLWVCVKRSKELPEGGAPDQKILDGLKQRLVRVRQFAPNLIAVRRDDAAREIWRGVYSDLSAERPGLTGALLARAEAHVLRLSMLFAVLDCSPLIRPEHLLAAIAVWDYAEASARYVFGDSLGDPVADELLRLLRASKDGMSRTQIRDHFGRHQSADRIGQALALLLENKLARCESKETGGRPAEWWLARR